jgi:hypothetical protein
VSDFESIFPRALPSVETLAIHSENVPKTVVVCWFVGGDDSLRCLLVPGDVSVHIPLVDKEYYAEYPRKHHEKVPPRRVLPSVCCLVNSLRECHWAPHYRFRPLIIIGLTANSEDSPNSLHAHIPTFHDSSCTTATITNPCAGTVGPDFDRSLSSNSRSISSGTSLPLPISNNVPTILRTM